MAIRVLIVDDSSLMRGLLTEIIGGVPDIEVVGAAPDALVAREMIKALNPDVLTLDVEMPKMDGLEFLRRLMRLRPMPVVMISSRTAHGSDVTLEALETGAFDFVTKPQADSSTGLQPYADEIREKIRAAHASRGRLLSPRVASARPEVRVPSASGLSQRFLQSHVVAIGASTGGTEAIKEVLMRLPADMPPIVMVQHMPEAFTASFARRLDGLAALSVVEAAGNERLKPGVAYLAPGHSHLTIRKSAGGHVTELSMAEPVNRHRPSVDVLLQSVAGAAGQSATALILTGMGKDGAQGMMAMRRAGAWTIGQDEASCVVYGMPREAARIGAVAEVASLAEIGGRLMDHLRRIDAK
jgi:two-component system chemotaxis response regulator CheB